MRKFMIDTCKPWIQAIEVDYEDGDVVRVVQAEGMCIRVRKSFFGIQDHKEYPRVFDTFQEAHGAILFLLGERVRRAQQSLKLMEEMRCQVAEMTEEDLS